MDAERSLQSAPTETSTRQVAAAPIQLGEDRWKAIVEQVKDYAIFMLTPDGFSASWNEGVKRVLGYEEAEFLGQPGWYIFTPEDRAAGVPAQELATAARDGSCNDDRWMFRKDGVRFWATGIATSLWDDAGGLIGFTKVMRDRTDEKRHDEALQASEERLGESEHRLLTALAAARMGTWKWDILSNQETFDEGLNQLFGVGPSEQLKTLEDVLRRIHPDDRDAVALAFSHSAGTGADLATEFRVVRPDGAIRWLRDHGKVFYDQQGAAVSMAGACVDVTERKQADEQLRQAQRMDAVGRLAGGVAHEVNNMMTAIIGFSDLVVDTLDDSDSRRGDLNHIRRAAGRAAMVTAQLLAFSRRQLLQPRVLDLNLVINELQPMLVRLLGEDKQFAAHLQPSLWSVHADRGQVEQVLINLALNARDAMPHGGRLAIETANVTLDDAYATRHSATVIGRGAFVRLVLSDTGGGIPEDVQSRIFEPFFTTKPVGQGTGLGLSMVYGIVKQSGGFIWVYSEPQQGTAFKVYLPRVDTPADSGSPAPPRPAPRGRETILVVEDDDMVRPLTARLLGAKGYTVLEARHGLDALESLRRNREVSLVLTDVIMPEMGGAELARRLAALYPELPVLFMSGFTDDEIVRRGLLIPGSPYLQKPFDVHTLALRVRELLDARAEKSPLSP